jgi:two-component system sensor histidine kinase AgrC
MDLEKDCERVNEIEILNPQVINNAGIYNLLIAKYNKAQKENIKISLECFFDFEKLKMPIYEFARILGILLDNAIEAASACTEKKVNIMFRDSSSQQTQIIKIKNTYINKNLDTNKIFQKGISEKENHMGMGLWEVQQILNRNNNVNIITSKDENYFTQQLEIYY